MVSSGIQWYPVVSSGIQWYPMVSSGIQWWYPVVPRDSMFLQIRLQNMVSEFAVFASKSLHSRSYRILRRTESRRRIILLFVYVLLICSYHVDSHVHLSCGCSYNLNRTFVVPHRCPLIRSRLALTSAGATPRSCPRGHRSMLRESDGRRTRRGTLGH